LRITLYLVKSTIVGALGGLLFGFDTAVIAGTTHQLTEVLRLTPTTLGLTVSIALWGTVAQDAYSLAYSANASEAVKLSA